MLKISNVPNEVYLVALDYECINRPDDPALAGGHYEAETRQRAWTGEGLEIAIFEYMTLRGPFSETDGEFAGVNGYEIS